MNAMQLLHGMYNIHTHIPSISCIQGNSHILVDKAVISSSVWRYMIVTQEGLGGAKASKALSFSTSLPSKSAKADMMEGKASKADLSYSLSMPSRAGGTGAGQSGVQPLLPRARASRSGRWRPTSARRSRRCGRAGGRVSATSRRGEDLVAGAEAVGDERQVQPDALACRAEERRGWGAAGGLVF